MKTCVSCRKTMPISVFVKGRARCRKCHNAHRKTWTKRAKTERTAKRYNIAPARLVSMYAEQNGCCAICNLELPDIMKYTDRSQAAVVDHCHITDKVRGLLCRNCNLMLGHGKDEAKRLYSGYVYLLAHSEKHLREGLADEEANQDAEENRQGDG